jgi:hypothetical protein
VKGGVPSLRQWGLIGFAGKGVSSSLILSVWGRASVWARAAARVKGQPSEAPD